MRDPFYPGREQPTPCQTGQHDARHKVTTFNNLGICDSCLDTGYRDRYIQQQQQQQKESTCQQQ